MFQDDAFRTLDRQEYLRLPAKVPLGRVVYTRQALPAVLPVNFSLDTDASVLLCTSAGSDLVRAIDGVVVAFEADEFTPGNPVRLERGRHRTRHRGHRPRRTRPPDADRPQFLDAAAGRGLHANRGRNGHWA